MLLVTSAQSTAAADGSAVPRRTARRRTSSSIPDRHHLIQLRRTSILPSPTCSICCYSKACMQPRLVSPIRSRLLVPLPTVLEVVTIRAADFQQPPPRTDGFQRALETNTGVPRQLHERAPAHSQVANSSKSFGGRTPTQLKRCERWPVPADNGRRKVGSCSRAEAVA